MDSSISESKKKKSMNSKNSSTFKKGFAGRKLHLAGQKKTTQITKIEHGSVTLKNIGKVHTKNAQSKIRCNKLVKNKFNQTSNSDIRQNNKKCPKPLKNKSTFSVNNPHSEHKAMQSPTSQSTFRRNKNVKSLLGRKEDTEERLQQSKKRKKDKRRLKRQLLSKQSTKSNEVFMNKEVKSKIRGPEKFPELFNYVESSSKEIKDSDESEDDVEIRGELRKTSTYQMLQKLLKDNPNFHIPFVDEDSLMDDDSSINSDGCSSEESSIVDDDEPVTYSQEYANKKSLKKLTDSEEETRKDMSNFIAACRRDEALRRDPVNKLEKGSASTSLGNKAREKLQAAKFRFLNEKLYTESGKDSYTYFQDNPDEFQDYHTGYGLQVSKWPINPVDKIISSLQNMNKALVIADMGCGDAKIARTLKNSSIHSFDLVALNEHVTPCNISKVPLSSESVDVVVFCLSLMGTNLKEYLQEAHRITKFGGLLKIAEVESRIENLDQFIKSIQSLGFKLSNKDVQHKLFVFLDFTKEKKKKNAAKAQDIVLRPCLYKKR